MHEQAFSIGGFTLTLSPDGLSIGSDGWPALAVGPLRPALAIDGQQQAPESMQATPVDGGCRLQATFPSGAGLDLAFSASREGALLLAATLVAPSAGGVLNRVELLAGETTAFGEGEGAIRIYESRGAYFCYVRGIAEPPRRMQVEGAEPPSVGDEQPREGVSSAVWEAWSPSLGRGLLVGFDTFARWAGRIETSYTPGRGMTRWALGFDGGDLQMLPGERLTLESAVWMLGDDPWRLLERWGEHIQHKHSLAPPAVSPVTWCSWYPYRLTVSEEKILANARVAAERLKPLGLSIMEVDLGWERGWLPSEYRENDQFPRGLAGLAQGLAGHGFGLGVWAAPYSVSEFENLPREHPEWLLPDEHGEPQAEGTWFWEPHGKVYVLDLTHPGAQGWLRESIASLAARGAVYLKTDFIASAHSGGLRRRHDPRLVGGGGLEAGRLGAGIMRQAFAADRPGAWLLNCGADMAGLGLFNLLYSCYDTGNTGFVGWRHLREVYTTVACQLFKQGRWGIIQPSCLCVGPPGTLEEARVRATATFLCGGEANISDDLTSLPEDRWQVLLSVLPPTSRPARPVDLFTADYPSIWHLPMEADWDRWDLVGLFNFDLPSGTYDYRSPDRREFSIALADLGLDPATRYHAYEFWSGRYLGEVMGALESAFFGPAVQLVSLRPVRPHPWVVGTGFHAGMGSELADVHWDQATGALRGLLHRPAGHRGSITVAAAGMGTPTARVSGRPAPVLPGAAGSWVLPLVTEADETEWEVAFPL